MASESKKRKAKNSYLMYGADRLDLKMKRIAYYTKRDRNKNKKMVRTFADQRGIKYEFSMYEL